MTRDRRTLDFYEANAAEYAAWSDPASPRGNLRKFIARLPSGGAALDLGCGGGWAAAEMRDAGLAVRAMDGSPKLAAQARAAHGIEVETALFADLDAEAAFDGIWASFSLLHDRRAAMPGNLARIRRALRPGGALYLGLKAGAGESRDALGRFYAYFGAEEIADLLANAGFERIAVQERQSRGYGGEELTILNVFAHRPDQDATRT